MARRIRARDLQARRPAPCLTFVAALLDLVAWVTMDTKNASEKWSWVQDRACKCGQPSCALAQAAMRRRRLRIVEAQETVFEEGTRPQGVRRPLLLRQTQEMQACA